MGIQKEEQDKTNSETSQQGILPTGKKAGVGLHFASLTGPYGIGDIGDSALAFIDKLASMDIGFWQFLPTGPTAYGDSPYQPLSAFAGNEMLIGLEPLVRLGLLTYQEPQMLAALPADRVDYGQLIPKKHVLLKRAAERFSGTVASADLKTAYEVIPGLARQTLAETITRPIAFSKTMHGERPWPEWQQGSMSSGNRKPCGRCGKQSPCRISRTVKIIQFLFDQQWQTLRRYARDNEISLFGDMPIYIALDSADAWAHPEILLIERERRGPHTWRACLPTISAQTASSGGTRCMTGNTMRPNGYQWWVERLQHAASQMDLVRIDHFRGFESFWAVQFGAETAREGEWVPGPADDRFNRRDEEAALGGLPIVAEDLGVITPAGRGPAAPPSIFPE